VSAERQGLLRCTDGSSERVVLKRVKRRVEVRPWRTAAARGLWALALLRSAGGSVRALSDVSARAPHGRQQPVLGLWSGLAALPRVPGSLTC